MEHAEHLAERLVLFGEAGEDHQVELDGPQRQAGGDPVERRGTARGSGVAGGSRVAGGARHVAEEGDQRGEDAAAESSILEACGKSPRQIGDPGLERGGRGRIDPRPFP
jgi:hypothetical protein